MKRVIYQPIIGEEIPSDAMQYTLPVSGFVVDVLVEDDFVTDGTILYDSFSNIPQLVEGELVLVNPIVLPESFIHHFSGWEA